jgi:hypothetical protein
VHRQREQTARHVRDIKNQKNMNDVRAALELLRGVQIDHARPIPAGQ